VAETEIGTITTPEIPIAFQKVKQLLDLQRRLHADAAAPQ